MLLNTETASVQQNDTALRLDSLQVAKRPGPRFVGMASLGHADLVTLLIFAEALADSYMQLLERTTGRPVSCELVSEIRGIIAKAEEQAKTEVLQALQGLEEVA